MQKTISFIIYYFLFLAISHSQEVDLGVFYGRVYAIYKAKDYGTGFRNVPASQYNPYPTLVINKRYNDKFSLEGRASFMPFVQYTGTRLYNPGFYSTNFGGNISLTANYSLT